MGAETPGGGGCEVSGRGAKSKERRAESSALRIPSIESAGRAEAEEPGKNQDLQKKTQ